MNRSRIGIAEGNSGPPVGAPAKELDIDILPEDPRQADVRRLVEELDAYMAGLYPDESIHRLDIETLARPDVCFLVARRGSEALGCGALRLCGEEYGEVKRVYVKPAVRGLRLGRLILERLEAEALARGLACMRLETGIHQPEALSLFARAGFSVRGPFGDYPVDDPNSVFMEKRIV
jgi:putative acetyltransferase